ncbi:MAG: hypothetical protein ACT4OK_15140 [Gemmobacter sp.]
MNQLLSMIVRRLLMRGLFGGITRLFGRGNADTTRRAVRGVRTINRFNRRR